MAHERERHDRQMPKGSFISLLLYIRASRHRYLVSLYIHTYGHTYTCTYILIDIHSYIHKYAYKWIHKYLNNPHLTTSNKQLPIRSENTRISLVAAKLDTTYQNHWQMIHHINMKIMLKVIFHITNAWNGLKSCRMHLTKTHIF